MVVAEMRGDERDALDMVPVITTALLEEHQLVTGIVVIVDPGVCVLAAGMAAGLCRLHDSTHAYLNYV